MHIDPSRGRRQGAAMQNEEDWERIRSSRGDRALPGISPVRVALLFGTAAIALALFATSYLADSGRRFYADGGRPVEVDMMSTGSISPSRTYTIRKSVLQSSPDAECIIRSDGSTQGEC
jgi:hypothetical protein